MRAILWKELRENLRWAALALGASCAMVLAWIVENRYATTSLDSIASEEVLVMLFFTSGAVALGLGVLQTLPESRQSRWAFLVHRALSPTRIFAAKAIAGLGLYTLAVVLPFLAMAGWLSLEGIEERPFHRAMVAPGLLVLLANLTFYFAGVLVCAREARWYGSRLLPLGTAALVAGIIPLCLMEPGERRFLGLFMTALVVVAVFALAARGSFCRSGEATGQPASARLSLAAILVSAVSAALLVTVVGLAVLVEELSYLGEREREWTAFRVDRAGDLWRFDYRIPSGNRVPVRFRARRVIGGDGDMLAGTTAEGIDWEGLDMHFLRTDDRHFLFPRFGPERFIEHLSVLRSTELVWVYSAAHGEVLGYRIVRERSGRIERSLVYRVGPDGFFTPPARPPRGFGRRLAVRWRFHHADLEREGETVHRHDFDELRRREVLVFAEGIYEIDVASREVREIQAAAAHDPIRDVSILESKGGAEIAILRADRIEVFSGREETVGRMRVERSDEEIPLRTWFPEDRKYTLRPPDDVEVFANCRLGTVEETGERVYLLQGDLGGLDVTRFVELSRDGTVARRQDSVTDLQPEALVAGLGLAAAMPPVLGATLVVVDEVAARLNGGDGGFLLRNARTRTAATSALVLAWLLSVLLGTAVTVALARRHALCRAEWRRWLVANALLGPTGILAMLALRDWPVRERCPACDRLMPVSLEHCAACNAALHPRETDDREIIDRSMPAGPGARGEAPVATLGDGPGEL